jgi:ATP-binding cassette subfamily F protein uup
MGNPNFLILDEPTNDLDIVTLNVLEEYLCSFQGCLLIVSHDRFFIDKVVDRVFAFEGAGVIKDFPGNYTQYKNDRDAAAAAVKQQKRSTPRPAEREKERKRKLSFNEQKEMQQLEVDMEALANERRELETALGSGSLSPQELLQSSRRVAEVIALLDEKEMRWLELSEI